LTTPPSLSISPHSTVGSEIKKTFPFKNYHETMAFVNASAWVSHREDHHPDMSVHYNRCVVAFSTHDAGGITLNDFICAAKMDALLKQ
jgi:4a-hydroxytetrahydrobiopterin dehydratase